MHVIQPDGPLAAAVHKHMHRCGWDWLQEHLLGSSLSMALMSMMLKLLSVKMPVYVLAWVEPNIFL